jgi:hypothetical protein
VRTILPLAGPAVLVAAFGLIESRHRVPLVPLRIFRSRALAGADALTVLLGTVAVGMPFVLTLYAQQVLGYSALKFGVSSVVLAVGVTAGAIAGQGAVFKAAFRPVAATGGRVVPPHHWTRVRPFIAALKRGSVPARQYITRYAISDWRGPST